MQKTNKSESRDLRIHGVRKERMLERKNERYPINQDTAYAFDDGILEGINQERERILKIIEKKIEFIDSQDTSKMTNHRYKVMGMLRNELLDIRNAIQKQKIKDGK